MRLNKLFEGANGILHEKKLGRAFNHLEDLVFFHGSSGAMEAISHLHDVATEEGGKSIRMKWDGAPQVYWGREEAGGPLILSGHNGWARGAKFTTPDEIANFIATGSGNPQTPEEKEARDAFGARMGRLHPLFDSATPKDFVGFVYADSLFLERPPLDKDGVYNFCPNPKSQTCYHVRADSELGKRIASAEVMVVGHAFFPEFGMPDDEQTPISDFSNFNSNPSLIVQGPIYNSTTLKVDTSALDTLQSQVKGIASQLDSFLTEIKGLKDLKEIIYRFMNQTAKAKRLDHLSGQEFYTWLRNSNVSDNKKLKIQEIDQAHGNILNDMFKLIVNIQNVKDDVIDQLESGHNADIWDTHGEGRVRYAGSDKQHGNVKFVPRKRWTP